MRTYLVVIDETEEAEKALLYAARHAANSGGTVEILAIIPTQDFVAWGAVQATIEDEAREHAEDLVRRATGTLDEDSGIRPAIKVKRGDRVKLVHDTIAENDQIAALVLGAAANGAPGPLVSHFAGADAGGLPCPVFIVPGALTRDDIDRLA
jgi:nucleotide-binding universal stress UspA family protein